MFYVIELPENEIEWDFEVQFDQQNFDGKFIKNTKQNEIAGKFHEVAYCATLSIIYKHIRHEI